MNNRSSKSSLFLMELIMSVLFFSLAASVCAQMFVKSHTLSKQSVTLNHAVIWSENVAECFYSSEGDLDKMSALLSLSELSKDKNSISMYFDKEYNPVVGTSDNMRYKVTGLLSNEDELLTLNISCIDTVKSETLYELSPVYFKNNTKN